MNIQAKLDQFRSDNPYDIDTQAKRLLASGDQELLLYVLFLGLVTAKQRQRHVEREHIKNIGVAPPKERFAAGRTTGSVTVVPTKKTRNAMTQLILDVWQINGEKKLSDATGNDLAVAINRELASAKGHTKNSEFYTSLKKDLAPTEKVSDKWDEASVRKLIESVYGEFRKAEAA